MNLNNILKLIPQNIIILKNASLSPNIQLGLF